MIMRSRNVISDFALTRTGVAIGTAGYVGGGAISPDGKYLVYSDLKGIHLKVIETSETQSLATPEVLKGVSVAQFDRRRTKQRKHPNAGLLSGYVRVGKKPGAVAGPGHDPPVHYAYAWSISPDGSAIAFTTRPGAIGDRDVWLMRPDGTNPRKLFEVDENSGLERLEWSPDGRRLIYDRRLRAPDRFDVIVEGRDLPTGLVTPIFSDMALQDFYWSPDGRIIYSLRERGLAGYSCNYWGLRMDPRTGTPWKKRGD
jgi:Tol biopolymer transport system component